MTWTTLIHSLHMTLEQQVLGAGALLTLLCIAAMHPMTWTVLRAMLGYLPGFGWRRGDSSSIEVAGVALHDESRLRHTHIVGATGSGKTVLLEQLIYQDIVRGHGALIIDPKGDRELYDRIRTFCKRIGRGPDLHLLSATHQDEGVRWNPCRLGGVSELQSKWFQSGVYLEPFYAKACELGLLQAFNKLMAERPKGFTPVHLVEAMESLSQSGKDDHLKGLSYELHNFAKGEWSEVLCCSKPEATLFEVSLLDITRKNEILFVDLPTESKAVQSTRLGKLLLQEMMLVSGMRKIYPTLRGDKPFSVFIDEFDAFATEGFSTFLNKGRSSGFMIHMAHQTLSDLKRVGEEFAGQVLGNCAVRFIFRQDLPDDAETWAKFLGTETVVVKTFQTQDGSLTGMSSNRESQSFRIHPDRIKELRTGRCIFSDKRTGKFQELRLPFPIRQPIPKSLPIQREQTTREPMLDPVSPEVADTVDNFSKKYAQRRRRAQRKDRSVNSSRSRCYSLGLIMLVSSCAFKQEDKGPAPLGEAPLPTYTARLRWGVAATGARAEATPSVNRVLRKVGPNEYTLEQPVTLPAAIPEQVRLELALPHEERTSVTGAQGLARFGGRSGSSQALTVSLAENSGAALAIDITGYRSMLLADQESEADVSLRFQTGDGTSKSVTITLRTPPSKIQTRQETMETFERAGGRIPEGVKRLASLNVRLHLLQILSLKNYSNYAVASDVPVQPRGTLKTHFHSVTLNQKWCGYSTEEKDWDEVLSHDLYLLPLEEAMVHGFATKLNENLIAGTSFVNLRPGEERSFGIYAQGPAVDRFIVGGYPVQALQPTRVVESCETHCGDAATEMYSWDGWKLAAAFWTGEGSPGATRACMTASCSTNANVYTADLCNQCAGWELTNGTQPWDHHRFCQSPEPGNGWNYPVKEFWHVNQRMLSVKSGTASYPFTLEFDAGSLQVPFRYLSPQNDSEARNLPVFVQKTVQSQ